MKKKKRCKKMLMSFVLLVYGSRIDDCVSHFFYPLPLHGF